MAFRIDGRSGGPKQFINRRAPTADVDGNESAPQSGLATVADGLEAPYAIEYHESIPSTNERARELASEGARDVVVLAGEQTRGRGRRGRGWSGPPGGIYASILFSPDRPAADAPLFTLAAAVAAVRACEAVGVDAAIKWPNDVVVELDAADAADATGADAADSTDAADADGRSQDVSGRGGRKLAGILTETESEADRLSWLVVGIGINANVDRESLPPGATSLRAELGADVDRGRVAREFLDGFADLVDDPDAVLPAWRERANTLGRRVRVETPGETIEGLAVDVARPGALVVETPTGRRTIHSGECTHLRRTDDETDRYDD